MKKNEPDFQDINAELLSRVRAGDEEAKAKMIEINKGLIFKVINNKNYRFSYSKEDLIQEGRIGLLRAIETYNEELGSFANWATKLIGQEIHKSIVDNGTTVRRPSHFIDKKLKYASYIRQHGLQDDETIKEDLNLTDRMLTLLKSDYLLNTVSIDAPLGDDPNDRTLKETTPNADTSYIDLTDHITDVYLIAFLKSTLPPLEYYIIYRHIIATPTTTLEEIGKKFGVTCEAIRQKEVKTLDKMRLLYDQYGNFIGMLTPKLRRYVDLDIYNIRPISPDDIIGYLFVRDDLSPLEQAICKEMLFGELKYIPSIIATKYGIPKDELSELKKGIKTKIREKIARERENYRRFQANLKEKFKTSILDADLDMNLEEFLKDYQEIAKRWEGKTYADVQAIAEENGVTISSHMEKKIREYLGDIEVPSTRRNILETKINNLKFGLYEKDDIPLKDLEKAFREAEGDFEEVHRDMALHIFGKMSKRVFIKRYPNTKYSNMKTYVHIKLEELYFGLSYNKNVSLTKGIYLKIRDKCLSKMTPEEVKLLDIYFGLDREPINPLELHKQFHMDKDDFAKFKEHTKTKALSIFQNLSNNLSLDFDIYRRYLSEHPVDLDEPSNTIVALSLFENKNYEEIATLINARSQNSITKKSVGEFLIDSLRRIDEVRFGIVWKPEFTDEQMLRAAEKIQEPNRSMLKEYIATKSTESFTSKYSITPDGFIKLKSKLKMLCQKQAVDDVELTDEDIAHEITAFEPANVLTVKMRQIISLQYGFKNRYNEEGKKLSINEIADFLKTTHASCVHNSTTGLTNIKLKKAHIKKNTTDYIDRDEILSLLEDVRIPIEERDYEWLRLFYKNGQSFEDISLAYGCNTQTVKFQIRKAIVTIKRYTNGEIEGKVFYDEDIAPLLKYFSHLERQIIIDFYKNSMTIENIAQKYGFNYGQMYNIISRLRIQLKSLKTEPKGLDFDYFYRVISDDDVPYYGDKKLALELFQLVHEKELSFKEINRSYHPELSESLIARIISLISIAVMKRKIGIVKSKDFSYDEVQDYFLAHREELAPTTIKNFEDFLKKHELVIAPLGRRASLLISKLLLREDPGYITLDPAHREEIMRLQNRHKDHLSYRDQLSILNCIGLNPRAVMKGSDKRQVLDFLYDLEHSKKIEKTLIITAK